MRLSQRLDVKRAEVRNKLNAAITRANTAEGSPEAETEMATHRTELEGLDTRYADAVKSEALADQSDANALPTDPGERREVRSLEARAQLSGFVREALEGREVAGAEAEYRAAVLGDRGSPGVVPMALLDPGPEDTERRADAVVPVAESAVPEGSRATMLERIFKQSIAARLGVTMRSVATGDAVFPMMTAGTAAAMKARDEAVDAGTAAFEAVSVSPVRLTARYRFRLEDAARLPGLESILRKDIGRAMSDQMDEQVVNGDGTAPNVSGFLAELATPDAPADVVAFGSWLAEFLGHVDGISAFNLSDLRAIIGPETFRKVSATFSGVAGQPEASAYEYVSSRMGGLSVSARLPDAAANVGTGIVALTGYPGANAVAPVWDSFALIRDPYTDAAKGHVSLTAVALWNFKIVREAAWSLFRFKLA